MIQTSELLQDASCTFPPLGQPVGWVFLEGENWWQDVARVWGAVFFLLRKGKMIHKSPTKENEKLKHHEVMGRAMVGVSNQHWKSVPHWYNHSLSPYLVIEIPDEIIESYIDK